MRRLLVIGYGNGLRRDDGAGPEVVRRLRALRLRGLEAVASHQLLPEHAGLLARHRRAVFVDASVRPGPVGLRVSRVEPAGQAGLAVHHSSPADILALAGWLFGEAPESWLVAISALDLGLGEGLSENVDRWCDAAVAEIRGIWADGEPAMAGREGRR